MLSENDNYALSFKIYIGLVNNGKLLSEKDL